MVDETRLNEHIWWRLLKVIYLFSWLIFCFGLYLTVNTTSSKPHKIVNVPETQINCSNGENYLNNYTDEKTKKKYIFIGNIRGIGKYEYLYANEEKAVKYLCETGKIVNPESFNNNEFDHLIPKNVNYQIEFVYKDAGSWWVFAKEVFLYILIAFLLIEIVKSIILYILGIGMFRGMLKYFVLWISYLLESHPEENVKKQVEYNKREEDIWNRNICSGNKGNIAGLIFLVIIWSLFSVFVVLFKK